MGAALRHECAEYEEAKDVEEVKPMGNPPRFWYKESSGRLYCDERLEAVGYTTAQNRTGQPMYLIGSQLTRQMAERIAAMFGGKVEVE